MRRLAGFARLYRGRVHVLRLLLLALLVVPFVVPLLWLVLSAFRPASELYLLPPRWWPSLFTVHNFREAWALLDFTRYFRNSVWIATWTVVGTVFSSSLVGYAFARLPARGKDVLFALLLATVMVPSAVTLIPLFVMYSKLGWVDTNLPLIAPHFFADAFYVFLCRQFFRSLPAELFDHAEMDGCNPWQSYWYVALPLARPALVTVAIFAAMGSWNDFLEPLVYLTSASKFTLSVGLSFFQGFYVTQLHYLIPLSLIALAPIVVLFVFAQRYLMRGIVTTGRQR